jgi:hypothetical protein
MSTGTMPMDDSQKRSRSQSAIIASGIVVLVLGVLLYSLSTAAVSSHHEKCGITKSISNCRQIILSIRLYAADEGGVYPDVRVPGAKDSNTVFKQLIAAGSLEDEKIFGAPPCSIFVPDGMIGSAPDFAQAIEPNENHWAMTKGLNDSSPPGIPLVFENPVDATWPPTWDVDDVDVPGKGKVRVGGRVVIGTNDTSVELMKLLSPEGAKLPLKPLRPQGPDIFGQASEGKDAPRFEILDIAWDQCAVDAKLMRYKIQKQSWPIGIVAGAIVTALIAGRSMRKKRRKLIEPAQP